jgi:hypothetical protein
MFENAVILDSAIHGEHKTLPVNDYSYARNALSIPLVASEIGQASREFPIVFAASGKLVPIAQMGFKADGNIYIDHDGKWTAKYIPAHIRRFPFVFGENTTAGQYMIMVDANSISTEGDGERLFDKGNIPDGGIVDRARTFLSEFQRELNQTEALLKPLQEADILVPRTITIREGDEVIGHVRDLRVVDTEKLAALDDATLAGWVRSGLMSVITAHLQSLGNWNNQQGLAGTREPATA